MKASFDSFLPQIRNFAYQSCVDSGDISHDELHLDRVVSNALMLAKEEEADLAIVIPAAYLHDCFVVEKNDPRRSQASKLSAEKAIEFLKSISYPEEHFDAISHAIEAHSFSANIEARTLEAQIVQDADRLDGLGSVGLARMFSVSARLTRPYYDSTDPLCRNRQPDDQKWALDHFFVKLVHTAAKLNTRSALDEGRKRIESMALFLQEFEREIKNEK
jgi:uncharacterized protein